MNIKVRNILLGLTAAILASYFNKGLVPVIIFALMPFIPFLIEGRTEKKDRYQYLFFSSVAIFLISFILFSLYMYFFGNSHAKSIPMKYTISSFAVLLIGIVYCALFTLPLSRLRKIRS